MHRVGGCIKRNWFRYEFRSDSTLHRRHQESEERYRDLFEEAPIAYVHKGLDSKFIRANAAARRPQPNGSKHPPPAARHSRLPLTKWNDAISKPS